MPKALLRNEAPVDVIASPGDISGRAGQVDFASAFGGPFGGPVVDE
jgi:hypothetical protein